MFSSPKTRRYATASLLLAILGLGLTCLLALNSAKESSRATDCLSNVHGIGFVCAMYAESHDGRLPRNFDDLTNELSSTKILICPSAKDQTHYSYAFTGLTNVWGVSSNVIILSEIRPNHHGRRVLLYDDGHVELKRETR